MGYQENLANAKSDQASPRKTGVEVTLTLPVMDTGLISTGLSRTTSLFRGRSRANYS